MPNMSRRCLGTYVKRNNIFFFINNEANYNIKQKHVNLRKVEFNRCQKIQTIMEGNDMYQENGGPFKDLHSKKKLFILSTLLKMIQATYTFGSIILFVDTLILKFVKFANFSKILSMLMLIAFMTIVSSAARNIFDDTYQAGFSHISKIHSAKFAQLKLFIDNIILNELSSIKWNLSTMSYVAMWVAHGKSSSNGRTISKQSQISSQLRQIDKGSKQRNKLEATVSNEEYFRVLYLLDMKYNRLLNRIRRIEKKLNKFNNKIVQDIDLKINNSLEAINEKNKVSLAEVSWLNSDQMVDKQLRELMKRYQAKLLKRFMFKWKNEKQWAIVSQFGEHQIRKIVSEMISTYDADKTGKADYALESSGGQIISTRCTESYHIKSAQVSIFGIPIMNPSNTPRVAISASVFPGECWAFQGFPGFLMVKLNVMIYVTGFTLEHISKRLTPFGKIDSAPKKFTVWDLKSEDDFYPINLGEYEYDDGGPALQYFQVQTHSNRKTDIVELKVESNHGNRNFTCVYRFRVHGNPFKIEPV